MSEETDTYDPNTIWSTPNVSRHRITGFIPASRYNKMFRVWLPTHGACVRVIALLIDAFYKEMLLRITDADADSLLTPQDHARNILSNIHFK